MRKFEQCTAAGLLMAALSASVLGQQLDQQGGVHFMIAAGHQNQITTAKKRSILEDIKVAGHPGATRINIKISPAVMPVISELGNPDRLVLDFPDTSSALRYAHLRVNREGISAIRVGIQPGDPPTTRVVLDLATPRAHGIKINGSEVEVTLGAKESVPWVASGEAGGPAAQKKTAESEAEGAGTTSKSDQAPAASQAQVPHDQPAQGSSVSDADPASVSSGISPDPGKVTDLDRSAPAEVTTASEPIPAPASEEKPGVSPPAAPSHPDASPSGDGTPAVSGSNNFASRNSEVPAADSKPTGAGPVAQTSASPNNEQAARSDPSPSPLSVSKGTQSVSGPQSPAEMAPSNSLKVTESAALPSADPPAVATLPPASLSAPPLNSGMLNSAVEQPLDTAKRSTGLRQLKDTAGEYVIGEQDQLNITVWKEPELSGTVVVRPDGKITVPLVNEIRVVGMTPSQVQEVLTEKLKPFVNVPQVTVAVRQISSRKVFLIGEVAREGSFPINSSTTILQIIAEAGGLKDFAKRKDIYVLRKEQGRQVRHRFNYNEVIRGKSSQENIVLLPGDTIVVP